MSLEEGGGGAVKVAIPGHEVFIECKYWAVRTMRFCVHLVCFWLFASIMLPSCLCLFRPHHGELVHFTALLKIAPAPARLCVYV